MNVNVYRGFDFSDISEISGKINMFHDLQKEFGINFKNNDGLKELSQKILVRDINIDFETHLYLENKGAYNFFDATVSIIENNLYQGRTPICLNRNPEEIYCNFELGIDIECYSEIVKIKDVYFVSYLPSLSEYSTKPYYSILHDTTEEKTFVRTTGARYIDSPDELAYLAFQLETKCVKISAVEYKATVGIVPSQLRFLASHFNFSILLLSEKLLFPSPRPEISLLLKEVFHFPAFRQLEIYASPDENMETTLVGQDAIVEDIIDQAEKSLQAFYLSDKEKAGQSIIVTAPTGSGKSLMFLLPAIYLSRKFPEALTIVITPIKSLMQDQVENYHRKTGLTNSAYINGDLSIVERSSVINGIQNGEIDILYLSPELLVSKSDITELVGQRKIALVIVDEAHIVTTWGQGFRPDYWYLGEYLSKLRFSQYNEHIPNFPIIAFTATAVYSPYTDDGMVDDICNSLGIPDAKKYLGRATRNDITYIVNSLSLKDVKEKTVEKYLFSRVIDRATDSLKNKTKTLIYVPYRRQAWDIYNQLIRDNELYGNGIGVYVSDGDKYEKKELIRDFQTGKKTVVIATKAFGMGIDIDDIKIVYHFAPTGTLCDYVQEVGRCARRSGLTGSGEINYLNEKKSLMYDNQLFGMSGIKPFEIYAIMEKILAHYNKHRNKNMVISIHDLASAFDPEFMDGYDESLVEAKIKTILMMIKKHFEQKVRAYPVIMARPASMFTKQFFHTSSEMKFKKHVFYKYSRLVEDNTYEINLKLIWERYYSELSFGTFKRAILSESMSKECDARLIEFKKMVIPYVHLSIEEKISGLTVEACTERVLSDFDFIYGLLSRNKIRKETEKLKDIQDQLYSRYNDVIRAEMITNNLPAILNGLVDVEKAFNQKTQVLSYVKTKDAYRIVYSSLESAFRNLDLISKAFVKKMSGRKARYLSLLELKSFQPILSIMDMLGYANYFTVGGDSPEIQIRLNGVAPFQRSLLEKEENVLWRKVQNRHHSSRDIMEFFFDYLKTNQERITFIEHYFMGRAESCKQMINDIRENRILNISEMEYIESRSFGKVKILSVSEDRSSITVLVNGKEKELANNRDFFTLEK